MPSQNYQVRGPSSRTALITIRVSLEERALLHQAAQERGETLSRMMVSRCLPKRTRTAQQVAGRQSEAIELGAIGEAACAKEPPSPARSDSKRLRDGHVMPGQDSLFDGLGGR